MLYSRDWYNVVNRLYFNKKQKFCLEYEEHPWLRIHLTIQEMWV